MNDFEVQKYTKRKFKKHSLSNIREFVAEKNNSKNELFLGFF